MELGACSMGHSFVGNMSLCAWPQSPCPCSVVHLVSKNESDTRLHHCCLQSDHRCSGKVILLAMGHEDTSCLSVALDGCIKSGN